MWCRWCVIEAPITPVRNSTKLMLRVTPPHHMQANMLSCNHSPETVLSVLISVAASAAVFAAVVVVVAVIVSVVA